MIIIKCRTNYKFSSLWSLEKINLINIKNAIKSECFGDKVSVSVDTLEIT